MDKLSAIESVFGSTEEADAYERWLLQKVAASLSDQRPLIPHEAVMRDLDNIIDEAERGRTAVSMSARARYRLAAGRAR